VNRSLPTAIVVLVVALVLAVTGTLVLTEHGSTPRQSLSAASLPTGPGQARKATPGGSENGHGTPATSQAQRQRQTAGTQTAGQTASRRKVRHFVGVALESHIIGNAKSFARITRLHPTLLEIYMRFGKDFPEASAARIEHYKSTPFIQLNPRRAPLRRIDRGEYNSYIRKLALQVKAFKHHVILSFGHEMNGHWSGWSRPHATPHQFIQAWRIIVRIFRHNHVNNVTWSWDPSHTGTSAREWWPGSRFVDRVGIDGYFRHGQTFRQIFQKQLRIIRRLTHKPVFIAETSVAKGHGQARQVRALFNGVRRYHLAGFVWFNVNRLEHWRLQHRPGAIEAFRRCTRRMAGYR
jgi:glycosyl hydrolase family 26